MRLSDETYNDLYQALQAAQTWVLGTAGPNTLLQYTLSQARHDALHAVKGGASTQLLPEDSPTNNQTVEGFANEHPHTALVFPVWKYPDDIDRYQNNNTMVAVIFNILAWDTMLQHILPPGVVGIDCVLRNSAGQAYTYRLQGPMAIYVGQGDWHDAEYNHLEQIVSFANPNDNADDADVSNKMEYWFSIYPSAALHETHENLTPIIMTVGLAVIFVLMMITLVLYDVNVVRKNKVILDAAAHSNAILAVSCAYQLVHKILRLCVRLFVNPCFLTSNHF